MLTFAPTGTARIWRCDMGLRDEHCGAHRLRLASRLPTPSRSRSRSSYLHEAWSEAKLDGVDGDCLAQASLFSALSELVTTYGEDATAKFAEGLAGAHPQRRILACRSSRQ